VPAEYKAAAAYGEKKDYEHFREDYSRSALLLQSLGINLNLAPVADIALNSNNECLKGRCFGETPEQVAEFVRISVEVSHAQGLRSCLKHFPGLGAAHIDPHQALAEAGYDAIVWQQRERIPFVAGIEAGADMIMTTHLLVPALDSISATGSPKIVGELIRKNLDFDGPVITDDLTMKGAESLGDIGERTVRAFEAGHDLLLFGQDYESAMRAYDHFARAVANGEIDRELLQTSLDRVAGLKFRLGRSAVS
jgi:beta-N-acetylhexosaminidase